MNNKKQSPRHLSDQANKSAQKHERSQSRRLSSRSDSVKSKHLQGNGSAQPQAVRKKARPPVEGKTDQRKTWGVNILRLSFVLVIVALISTVLLARYFSEAREREEISLMETDIVPVEVDLSTIKKPGDIAVIEFDITNYIGNGKERKLSSVSQSYSLILTQTSELPLKYILKCTSEGKPPVGAGLGKTTELVISEQLKLGVFPMDKPAKHSYELTVTWPKNSKLKPQLINSGEYDATINLSIISEQTVEQKQGGGK